MVCWCQPDDAPSEALINSLCKIMDVMRLTTDSRVQAADLLLFLLSELAPVAAVKPQLCAADAARVHKYYAAVKMRQRACMAMLNAQLPASAAV